MEPPPLTASKRRDPLRDGGVFQQQLRQEPHRLFTLPRPSPLVPAARDSDPLPASLLLRSAAEAATLNRSAEAQHIRTRWEAMVGASPLPQAFRQALSPADAPSQLGFHSPAACTPFLRSRYGMPPPPQQRAPSLALGMPRHSEPMQTSSMLYHGAIQQRQQQQQQQQQQPQGLGLETSKFTRVVHSHSPSYQAVMSSTLEVVRQSSSQPQQYGIMPQHRRDSVVLEELPAILGQAAQQQQQQRKQQQKLQQEQEQQQEEEEQEPIGVLQGPLLATSPSEHAAPSEAATAAAAAEAGMTVAPASSGDDGRGLPLAGLPGMESSLPARQAEEAQEHQPAEQLDANKIIEPVAQDSGKAPSLQCHIPALPVPRSPMDDVGSPGRVLRTQAQVDAMVHNVSSPMPDRPAWSGDMQQEAAGAGLETELPSGWEQQQQWTKHTETIAAPPSPMRGMGGAAQELAWRHEQQQSASHAAPPPSQQREQSFEGEQVEQEQREREEPGAEGGAGGAGVDAEEKEEPAVLDAALPSSAQLQPSRRSKANEAKAKRKKTKHSTADGAGVKRRTMVTRRDAAPSGVQPILRSIGGDSGGMEVTRSGRTRLPPLPFWTNAKLVMNSSKDVVGIEMKEDLLGLVPPQQQQAKAPHKGAQVIKEEADKVNAGGATAGKRQQAEKPTGSRPASRGKHARVTAISLLQAGAAAEAGSGRPPRKQPAAVQQQPGQRRQRGAAAKAGPSCDGIEEIEAALQLQELASKPVAGGVAPTLAEQPPACASGIAAAAATAGTPAATQAAKGQNPAGMNPARGRKGFAAAAARGASGSRAGQAFPAVEGVPPDIVMSLAQRQPQQKRRKCGHCKHCLNPTGKKACLTLQALEGLPPISNAAVLMQAQLADAEKPSSRPKQQRQQGQGKRGRAKGQPAASQGGGGESQQPTASKAAGEKRAADSAEQKAPAAKRAKPLQSAARRQQHAHEEPKEERNAAGSIDAVEHAEAAKAAEAVDAAEAAEGVGQGAEEEEKPADEDGWTASQVAALQRAWLQLDPTANNFWQLVAKQVPGKTATECYNRHMAKHPTPPHAGRKAAPKKYLAAAKEGAHMPSLKPGASKQVLQNAARKYSRQLQWQQKASKAQAESGGTGLGEELLEEMEAAERKDRYIDQILRKRQGRPLGVAVRRKTGATQQQRLPGAMTAAASVSTAFTAQGAGGRKLWAADSEREVREVLAGLQGPEEDEDDRDSQEGSDYYWSDA